MNIIRTVQVAKIGENISSNRRIEDLNYRNNRIMVDIPNYINVYGDEWQFRLQNGTMSIGCQTFDVNEVNELLKVFKSGPEVKTERALFNKKNNSFYKFPVVEETETRYLLENNAWALKTDTEYRERSIESELINKTQSSVFTVRGRIVAKSSSTDKIARFVSFLEEIVEIFTFLRTEVPAA